MPVSNVKKNHLLVFDPHKINYEGLLANSQIFRPSFDLNNDSLVNQDEVIRFGQQRVDGLIIRQELLEASDSRLVQVLKRLHLQYEITHGQPLKFIIISSDIQLRPKSYKPFHVVGYLQESHFSRDDEQAIRRWLKIGNVPTVTLFEQGRNLDPLRRKLHDLLSHSDFNHLSLIGEGGTGKFHVLQHLCLDLATFPLGSLKQQSSIYGEVGESYNWYKDAKNTFITPNGKQDVLVFRIDHNWDDEVRKQLDQLQKSSQRTIFLGTEDSLSYLLTPPQQGQKFHLPIIQQQQNIFPDLFTHFLSQEEICPLGHPLYGSPFAAAVPDKHLRAQLKKYDYPDNIRGLRATIQQAMEKALAEGSRFLRKQHFPRRITNYTASPMTKAKVMYTYYYKAIVQHEGNLGTLATQEDKKVDDLFNELKKLHRDYPQLFVSDSALSAYLHFETGFKRAIRMFVYHADDPETAAFVDDLIRKSLKSIERKYPVILEINSKPKLGVDKEDHIIQQIDSATILFPVLCPGLGYDTSFLYNLLPRFESRMKTTSYDLGIIPIYARPHVPIQKLIRFPSIPKQYDPSINEQGISDILYKGITDHIIQHLDGLKEEETIY